MKCNGCILKWTSLFLGVFFFYLMMTPLDASESVEKNKTIKRVIVIFKTHLDIGFTDLSSKVEARYRNEFIPKALEVAERLQSEGGKERYVWSCGTWLVWDYLRHADNKAKMRLEAAIRRGDIVYHAMPYTLESETANKAMFACMLNVSAKLDAKFGKKTLAAKMTDVPGHTRSIVPLLDNAGIKLLHVGVNPATPIPEVPDFCRWQDPSGAEIILMYQKDYGTESLLPDGETVAAIYFTGDNHGPQSYETIKTTYQRLREKYPHAEVNGGSFNDLAVALEKVKNTLPIVRSEIGDTWIYGYGSAPARMARFRALQRCFDRWTTQNLLDPMSDSAIDFVLRAGMIAEHTQGCDVKTHLKNWDKYDVDSFLQARGSLPEFRKMDASWREIDNYVEESILLLPPTLQAEARTALSAVCALDIPNMQNAQTENRIFKIELGQGKNRFTVGPLSYQMYDHKDYTRYLDAYLRSRPGWAFDDIGKTGLDRSKDARSLSSEACIVREKRIESDTSIQTFYELRFQNPVGGIAFDSRLLPKQLFIGITNYKNIPKVDMFITLIEKPAVRLPEAYFFSFKPTTAKIKKMTAEKTGGFVDLSDVVKKGARQMHGIDRFVDIETEGEQHVRITTESAFLMTLGEPRGLSYSTEMPDFNRGVHFNLSNNLWGTNFSMWNEGSLTYRFSIEWLPPQKK